MNFKDVAENYPDDKVEKEVRDYEIPTHKNPSNKSLGILHDALGEGKSILERMERIYSDAIKHVGYHEIELEKAQHEYDSFLEEKLFSDEECKSQKSEALRVAVAVNKYPDLKARKDDLFKKELGSKNAEIWMKIVRSKFEQLSKSHETNSRQATLIEDMIQLGEIRGSGFGPRLVENQK